MTTKRKRLVTGLGGVGCLVGAAVSLVLCQVSVASAWGAQVQLLPFRPWTGRMASGWDVMAQLCGYAVSLFVFAAIILFAVFIKSLISNRTARQRAEIQLPTR
jgi:hypothetical protein